MFRGHGATDGGSPLPVPATATPTATEQKGLATVGIETDGGRRVVDLDIARRLADVSGARLLRGSGRGNRCGGDRYRGSSRRQQRCDVGQFDSHGAIPSMVGPGRAHSRIAIRRICVVPADNQPRFPPMGISAYLPAPMAPVLPIVITVTVIVAGRLVARRASAEVDGHRLSTGPQRFLGRNPGRCRRPGSFGGWPWRTVRRRCELVELLRSRLAWCR